MRLSRPWQAMQWVNSSSLPRASGRSFLPWCMEMSLQRTMPCWRARSWVRFWSGLRVMPVFGSALKPIARLCRRYSPGLRCSTRCLPVLSDSTLTVILVLRLRACTKAPRNGLPSGPVTVPVMVAASTPDSAAMIEPTPSIRRVVARIDIPPGLNLFVESLSQCSHRRHRAALRVNQSSGVMAGLVPAIHVLRYSAGKTWMPATSAGMTLRVMPNGPSPRPDVSRLDHLAPALNLDLDALGELLGRALDLVEIERVQALLYVRQLGNIDDAAVEQADDLLGRASRDQNSEPLISGEDRMAGFRGGRDVRQPLRSPLARQHERTQGPFLDMRHAGRPRADADRDMPRHNRGDRRG